MKIEFYRGTSGTIGFVVSAENTAEQIVLLKFLEEAHDPNRQFALEGSTYNSADAVIGPRSFNFGTRLIEKYQGET